MEKKKIFKSPKWTEYQNVKVLEGKIDFPKDDKVVKEFRNYINKEIEQKKDKNSTK